MKKSVFLTLALLVSLQTAVFSQKKKQDESFRKDTVSVDSLEYRLIVFDPGFETWLAEKPPVNYYSNSFYRTKNVLYVTEWNLRYETGRYGNIYSDYIDYNPKVDYGIDLNYKLYYYFKYFEMKNHVSLLPGNM